MSARFTLAVLMTACWILPASAQRAETIFRHEARIHTVAFSPDGKSMAAAGDGGEVILWETATGKRLALLRGHDSSVTRIAFGEQGKVLAASSKDLLILWDLPGGKVLAKVAGVHFLGKHGTAAFQTCLVSGMLTSDRIERRGMDRNPLAKTWRSPGLATRLTLSPDGERMALLLLRRQTRLVVLDVATMTERASFDIPDLGEIYSLAFSPDNNLIAIGSGSGATVWDVRHGRLHKALVWHNDGDGEADT
jgi:WD40 repeat protein